MRSTRNFHPEWGYLAPSPNFVRTARIALVAVLVGGMAGASIVLSMVERPADEISVAARTLSRSGEVALAPVGTPRAAQVKTQAAIQDQPLNPAPTDGSKTASESSATNSSPQPPTSVAEVPAAGTPSPAKAPSYQAPARDRRRCKRRRPGSLIRCRVTPPGSST